LHVLRGLLAEVEKRHDVQLNDLAHGYGILIGKLRIVADARVVDQQVDSSRQAQGKSPELIAKDGLLKIAGQNVDPPRGQLGGQSLELVEAASSGQDGHPTIVHELANHLTA
jgi:hypothetical protein